MNHEIKKKLFTGIIWSTADKLITQVGYLAVTLFIARTIGPESFGLIGMLTIFMLLSESIINNGFSQALVQRSNNATREDFSTIFYINIVWSIFIYFILFFAAPLIADFYKKIELINISRVLFLVVIINSLSVVVRAQLTIKVDFKSQAIANVIATISSSIIAIYMALSGYGYWSYVSLIILKALISSASLWFFSRWIPMLLFSKESFRTLFKFGSNLMVAGLISTLVNNLYIVLIGRYFNATSVGYFSQATNLTTFLSHFISTTLQSVTYPILTSIKEDRQKLVILYKQLLSITMLFSFPALAGFAALSDTFIELFLGSQWLPIVPIVKILCIARMIIPISAINMNILNAIGRSDLFLKVDLMKLPIILISILIAVPYGLNGVAIAILSTTLLSFFINAYYPWRLFNFGPIAQLIIAKRYIFSSVIVYMSVSTISFSDLWLEIFIKIITGISVYLSLLFILRDRFSFKIAKEIISKFKKAE
ncbi:lipopolysaccharide biosynthesis protein [Providencia sp. PROV258]|uniref:lipopolysaccharide biosynthesis protein n=1 Tax=Providencia sp. PROV258 TaxID=2949946 RepID=UPI00234B1E1E|nr:lipopolysaccharide biosynthesis protein [Providencia sp. PROV258]